MDSPWTWEDVLIAYSYRWYAIEEEFTDAYFHELEQITRACCVAIGAANNAPWHRPPRYTVEH